MKKKSLIILAPAEDNNIETWDEIVDFLGVNIKSVFLCPWWPEQNKLVFKLFINIYR